MINVILKTPFILLLSLTLSILLLNLPLQYFIGYIAILLLLLILTCRPLAGIYLIITILILRSFISGSKLSFSSTINFDPGGIINLFITTGILFYILIRQKKPIFSKSSVAYILFLLFSFVSCFYTKDRFGSLKYFIRMLTPFMFYSLCVYEIHSVKNINKLLNYVISISWIPLIIGLVELTLNFSKDYRVQSVFGHPNPFSFYLILVFIIAYSEHLCSNNIKRKIYLSSFCAVTILLLIFTYCRIAWAAFLVSFVLISIIFKKYLYIFAGIVLVFIVAGVNYNAFYVRIKETMMFFQSGNIFDLNTSIGWRFKTWDTVLYDFYRRPLLGHGLRSHFFLIESLFGRQTSVHNSYLEILYDTGILGFLSFILFLMSICLSVIKLGNMYHNVKSKVNDLFRKYYVISIAVFFSYCIIMVSDNILEYYDIGVFYWLIFAIAQILVYKKEFLYDDASI